MSAAKVDCRRRKRESDDGVFCGRETRGNVVCHKPCGRTFQGGAWSRRRTADEMEMCAGEKGAQTKWQKGKRG